MKNKILSFVFILLSALGCNNFKTTKTTCEVTVLNTTGKKVADWWVDCGGGYFGLGILSPGNKSVYGDMPGALGSPVHIKWKYVDDPRTFQTTNVLGRTVQANDQIKMAITQDKAIPIN